MSIHEIFIAYSDSLLALSSQDNKFVNICETQVLANISELTVSNFSYLKKICSRELKTKSFDWFYKNVSEKFKRFGSAKVVRSLYKHADVGHSKYHCKIFYHMYSFKNFQGC